MECWHATTFQLYATAFQHGASRLHASTQRATTRLYGTPGWFSSTYIWHATCRHVSTAAVSPARRECGHTLLWSVPRLRSRPSTGQLPRHVGPVVHRVERVAAAICPVAATVQRHDDRTDTDIR